MKRHSQQGIALIITLIMLSVITLLTVAFLAISRRNKQAVTTSMTQVDAKTLSDAALAHAQAELVARMLSTVKGTNAPAPDLLNFELLVSTNYINPLGYDAGEQVENPTNVNYEYYVTGATPLSRDDFIRTIGNLSRNPRPPVFVPSLTNPAVMDFRYYLDLNRNGRYDTNGLLPVMNPNGGYYDTNWNETPPTITASTMMAHFIGDPEWIGILERPDAPHSGTNRFIGRYCYIVLPVGKTLDLNYIHNQAKMPLRDQDGFLRNQGYGSWELNLAAFLADLNTNYWNTNFPAAAQYVYNTNMPGLSTGVSFEDARELLRYRYSTNGTSFGGDYTQFLPSASKFFLPAVPLDFGFDGIDNYANGPLMVSNSLAQPEPAGITADAINLPWPGSDNTNHYYSLFDELFDPKKINASVSAADPAGLGFVGRLIKAGQQTNSYDRYTFSRLLSQLGTDSVPESAGKIHINYKDPMNFVRWTNNPVEFFTNAAIKLMSAYYGTTITNINIHIYNGSKTTPTNYPIEIHRLLQVAANIYDATQTNDYPTVFRPQFSRNGTNVYITSYVEQVDTNFWVNPWRTVDDSSLSLNDNVYGIPLIVGAKKFAYTDSGGIRRTIGYPNFNELALYTVAQLSRRLEISKPANSVTPDSSWRTNQMYILSVTNVMAMEAWNSYLNKFPNDLTVVASNQLIFTLVDESGLKIWATTNSEVTATTNIVANSWLGATNLDFAPVRPFNFRIPLTNIMSYMPPMQYSHSGTTFVNTNNGFEVLPAGDALYIPQWKIQATNRLQYLVIRNNRVVDVVNSGDLAFTIDVTGNLQKSGLDGNNLFGMWDTNQPPNWSSPIGIANQLNISSNLFYPNADNLWKSYNETVSDRPGSVIKFANFLYTKATNSGVYTNMQAPFTPLWTLLQTNAWRVNDPFVHYNFRELDSVDGASLLLARQLSKYTNLWAFIKTADPSIGNMNPNYNPWGGYHEPAKAPTGDEAEGLPGPYEFQYRDPGIGRSDDWDFPSTLFPTIGWLGRVHRGTPWQTIYLKSESVDTNKWEHWAHNVFTQPTNDWRLLDIFTTAPNENASRGLLSVNQTNLAAWSAALSGVIVLSNSIDDNNVFAGVVPQFTPMDIKPSSIELSNIWYSILETNRVLTGFTHMGDFLAIPQLTVKSPFLNLSDPQKQWAITDAAYERIPQQILSLLRLGEPRFVVYCWGQSLKPADNSIVFDPPNLRPELQNVCTNYQITGEVATRAIIRFEQRLEQRGSATVTNYQGVVETYNILPGD